MRELTENAIVINSLEKNALMETGIQNCDIAIVCIAEHMDTSILTTLNLVSVQQQRSNAKQAHGINLNDKTDNANIGAKGVRALSEALKVNKKLSTLNLTCAQHQQDSTKQAHEISHNGKAVNGISAEAAGALSEALKVNTTLTALDMNGPQQQQGNAK